ncbi:hypothetical protein DFH08DRAFT_828656 [Mycena albidolilacea]|uniref:Pentatricopeptide repeat-containing protein n=1 Tax=Mycena albidolilacea TaxID=1033008 RepID=A0AAD7ATD2_9AGAR|nr:hypothetical protein DFH08DRAFT_828656 [Mycena albidolilacea]
MRFVLPRLTSLARTPSCRISESFGRANHLRYATRLATRPHLDQRTPQELEEEKKTNDLVASFVRFIDLVKDEPKNDQKEWIRDRFQREDLQIPSRAKIAENVIHSLFESRLFAQAVAVYQHMLDDGLLPSPSTDALFLAMSLVTSRAPGETQLEGLKTIIAYRSFTDDHFIELLDHLVSLNVPPDTIRHLGRVFVSVKGEGYRPSHSLVMKLVDIQAQAGEVVAAAETVAEFKDQSIAFETPAEPYARMIKSAPADNQAAVDWIMGVMREKDVPINIMVFNAILARQSQTRNMRKAFAFYSVLCHLAESTPLRPNAVTYKFLFRILGYQYKTKYRPNRSRAKEPTGTIVPPRRLFADMMVLWFSAGAHPPLSDSVFERQAQLAADQGLLHVALRTFLHLEDYAGALVVLRLVSAMGMRITERTYLIVLRCMARRVFYDVYWAKRQFKQPFFAFELMGPFDHAKMDEDPQEVYEWIMEGLLKHNCEKAKGEGKGKDEPWKGRIPSVSEIIQPDQKLSGDKINYSPIVVMLQRALQMDGSPKNGVPWGKTWREKTMIRARKEMIPENIQLWAWPKTKTKEEK